ncbi:bestrophin family protein [Tundrisphaera lichenicola]|uniref:bestrophin family protein n=1 Tax=Tundrisphaera lichenicola TaxID=2029860 RepID=UPI003EC0AEC7
MVEYDSKHWTSHLFDVHNSMFHAIFGRILLCVAWSVVVLFLHHALKDWLNFDHISVPTTIHTLVGFALGTLLVFRTNTSYDRFWEGRKLWGSIVNESRNLARLSSIHLKDDPQLFRSVVRWTVAWSHSVMNSLRGTTNLGPAAEKLPPGEVQAVLESGHVPLEISRKITGLLIEARDKGLVSDIVLTTLDQNVQLMIDYLGGCERIKKTPLPFAYMVHIRRALVLYCFTLPFALVDSYGWGSIVGTLLVAYIFFGIEEIGVEIENPFDGDDNDLPLGKICKTIEADLLGMIDEEPVGEPAMIS